MIVVQTLLCAFKVPLGGDRLTVNERMKEERKITPRW